MKALLKILSALVLVAALASCSIPRGDVNSQMNESDTSSDLAQSSSDSKDKPSLGYESYFMREIPYEDLSLVSEESKQNAVIIEDNGDLAVVPFDDYVKKNFDNKTVLFNTDAVVDYAVVNDKIFFATVSNIIYETDFRGENTDEVFDLKDSKSFKSEYESTHGQYIENFYANEALIWFSFGQRAYRLYIPDKKLDSLCTHDDMISFVPVSNRAIKYFVYSQQYKDFITAGNDPDDVFFPEYDYYISNSETGIYKLKDGDSLEVADDDENYMDDCERATALEAYLRANLSGDDYGGLYLFKGDKVELTVLAINRGNIDKVIGEYSGKPYKVNILEGDYCPHSKLEAFAEKVEALNSPSERKIIAILSEEYSFVAVNVHKEALPEVEDSINKLAAELSMPEGSWKLVTLDPNGENPNT
mgnify:CR=1 FL=1